MKKVKRFMTSAVVALMFLVPQLIESMERNQNLPDEGRAPLDFRNTYVAISEILRTIEDNTNPLSYTDMHNFTQGQQLRDYRTALTAKLHEEQIGSTYDINQPDYLNPISELQDIARNPTGNRSMDRWQKAARQAGYMRDHFMHIKDSDDDGEGYGD